MLCSDCKKNTAVVFVNRIIDGKPNLEGLCLACAKKRGINQLASMMKQYGASEEDIESMNEQFNEIISIKSTLYRKHIAQTLLIPEVANFLKSASSSNRCILVSNACSDRVNQTLDFYNLKEYFYQLQTLKLSPPKHKVKIRNDKKMVKSLPRQVFLCYNNKG